MRAVLSQLRARLARRADSEHGQALVRITLIALILVYTLISAPRWPVSGRQLQQLFCLIAIGQATAVLIFCRIVASPPRSHLRRTLGMLADYGLIGLAMTWMGAPMAFLYVVLLWITIGNGLRFGSETLHTAVAMATLSFGTTLSNSTYWQGQLGLGIALLGALIVVPMSLLRTLRERDQAMAGSPAAGIDAASQHGRIPTPSTPPRV
ncbi:RpfH protein [Xanthomonas campestris pv. campestris]|uniref:RpfH protein n=2 Tax=Xanthomonas campestris pv. campestris TaxID=340 RepID=Q8P9K6_XANCP|nr:RpfH protein [Xanthomonas campestris pv. campestris str. ATCC 33913]RFF48011.1 RpfH protein [Xanthomonas campestris]RFF48795.1 RpfH protein [Xanthomonas campestris pv. campestris]RFF68008.1 RpfH protein [Xanthomonas campestris pv. raphani]RFF71073.1 RpfH protein [Xanthomonas campestris pv. campestris]